MRRCPKCNRTYTNDAQKFCTKDGMSLVAASGALGETVRLDSSELRTTQDDPEVTKVISRELPSPPIEEFDPYKTVISRPQETSTGPPLTTADLMSPSIPPPPTRAISPPPSSGPIEPPPPPPPPSIPQPSGPISSPSQPLQNASGDLGQMTMASFAPPPPLPARTTGELPVSAPAAMAPAPAPAKKKSKMPLVLGILAVLLVLGLGVAGVAYWFVVRPMLEARRVVNVNPEPPKEPTPIVENTPSETPATDNSVKDVPAYSPPADAIQFVNSKDTLDGKLADNFVDFSFYYPQRWQKDPAAGVRGATNFAKVQRQLAADAPQEIFAVGWYESTGARDTDQLSYPKLVAQTSSQYAKEYPEYRKISEGPTKVGAYDAHEFRFSGLYRNTDRGDVKIWGRVFFVPPVDGSKKGVTLLLLASSLASELKSVDDVGVKGELPMMLESFRFGKNQ